MSWDGDSAHYRGMLRRVLKFLAARKMLYLLPLEVQEWWPTELAVIAKEESERR